MDCVYVVNKYFSTKTNLYCRRLKQFACFYDALSAWIHTLVKKNPSTMRLKKRKSNLTNVYILGNFELILP